MDWRPIERDVWEISVETEDGRSLKLASGGAKLFVDGGLAVDEKPAEYEGIYAHFAELVAAGRSHVYAAPFTLVADAFMIGTRKQVEAFVE
jgi:D-galactose 1-dehydrogenase